MRLVLPVVATSGCGTDDAASCAAPPACLLQSRMQGLDAAQYKSSTDCALKILKEEGIGASSRPPHGHRGSPSPSLTHIPTHLLLCHPLTR